jgi:predicted nucleotidyltransferase
VVLESVRRAVELVAHQIVASHTPVPSAIVYGSAATRRLEDCRDVDLILITSEPGTRKNYRRIEVDEILCDLNIWAADALHDAAFGWEWDYRLIRGKVVWGDTQTIADVERIQSFINSKPRTSARVGAISDWVALLSAHIASKRVVPRYLLEETVVLEMFYRAESVGITPFSCGDWEVAPIEKSGSLGRFMRNEGGWKNFFEGVKESRRAYGSRYPEIAGTEHRLAWFFRNDIDQASSYLTIEDASGDVIAEIRSRYDSCS